MPIGKKLPTINGKKLCSICNKFKSVENDFSIRKKKNGKQIIRHCCKECWNGYERKRYINNKDKNRIVIGENTGLQLRNMTKYSMDRDSCYTLLSAQNDVCAICNNIFSRENPPCIDHDHLCCNGPFSCGKCVRGLLCNKCNVRLGFLETMTSDWIDKAKSYIETKRIKHGM